MLKRKWKEENPILLVAFPHNSGMYVEKLLKVFYLSTRIGKTAELSKNAAQR